MQILPARLERSSGWQRTLAVATPGLRKRREGSPCEDAVRAARPRDGTAVLAVADGAGSALRAIDAAQLAVSVAVSTARDMLATVKPNGRAADWGPWGQAYRAAVGERFASAIEVLEYDSARVAREWKTTLTVAVVTTRAVVALRVGDGYVVGRRSDGTFHLLMPPDRPGENANETRFLTTARRVDDIDMAVVTDDDEGLDGIVLTSDALISFGLGLRDGRPVDPNIGFFSYVLDRVGTREGPTQLIQALLSAPQILESTGDDISVVAAVR